MTIFYVDPTNGNTTRDGLDFHGFALSGASYDDTGHADGDYRLESTGAFGSYTHTAGDIIYLTGGAGITAGPYTIASKVSADAILLTSSAGSDSTADVTSSDGPLKDLTDIVETSPSVTIAAGDEVYCAATGNESVGANYTFQNAMGSIGSPVIVRGMDGTNATSPATYTYLASTTMGSIFRWTGTTAEHIHFVDLVLDCNAQSTRGLYANIDGLDGIQFWRCRATDTVSAGECWNFRNNCWRFFGCEADNAAGAGINMPASRAGFFWTGGSVHDCASYGFRVQSPPSLPWTITSSLVYDNGDDGISVRGSYGDRGLIDHNTVDGNTGDGISVEGTTFEVAVTNNAMTTNGGYGLRMDGTNALGNGCHRNFYGSGGEVNTAGQYTGTFREFDAVTTGSASYADAASGDFTPGTGSALIGAGSNGSNIGAVAHAAGGGGGGLAVSVFGGGGGVFGG